MSFPSRLPEQYQVFIDATWTKKSNTGVEQVSRTLMRAIREAGFSVHEIKTAKHWVYGQFVTVPATAWRKRKGVFLYPYLPPVPWAFMLNAGPNVVFVHDLVPMERAETGGAYTRHIARRTLPYSLRMADFLIVATETLAKKVKVFNQNVLVWRPKIANGFSLEFQAAPAGNYLLFIGTVEPRKNIPYLVRVAEALETLGSNIRIKVAGRLGWGTEVEHHAGIEYLGYVDASDMKLLIENASLFVTASSEEGIGLPILEVGHAGLPAMVFREAIPTEVLPTPALTFSGDSEIDAAAILSYLNDPSRVAQDRKLAFDNTADWNKLAEESHGRLRSMVTECFRMLERL